MQQVGCQHFCIDSRLIFARDVTLIIKQKKVKMTSIKARLNRTRLGGDGMYPLVIQLIHGRMKREISTPFRLPPAEFNATEELAVCRTRSKQRISEIREINEYLIYIKEDMSTIVHSLEERGDFTVDDVVCAYRSHNDKSRFFVYADFRMAELTCAGKHGTASNYRAAVNAFERYLGARDLLLDDLTRKTLEDFMAFQSRQGNTANTVAFYVKQLRALYNKAADEGYVHTASNPFHRVKLKGEKTPKRAISKQEISRISGLCLEGKHPHLELARDLFMFSLYSRGMAFVDMCYLRHENIRGDVLVYKRRKTGQWLQIKIEPPLKALLHKYADSNSLYLLPMLRKDDSYRGYRYIQRRLNKRMREVGDILGFGFPLTFYVARHTWATLAYEKGVPMSVISEGMGHTSEKTTRIYLADLNHQVIDKANRLVMNCWNL